MRTIIKRYERTTISSTATGKLIKVRDRLIGTIRIELYNSADCLVSTFTL